MSRRGLTVVAVMVTSTIAAILASGALASHDALELVSTGPAGGNGAFAVAYGGSSADGRRAFFQTSESLVAADSDGRTDVYERANGVTSLVSTGSLGGNGAFNAFLAGSSRDGTRVFFGTAERLEGADTDSQTDLYERTGGSTTLLSTGSTGGNGALGAFFDGSSEDGSRVFFHSSERLVATDTDSQRDVYERAGGTTTLVSVGPTGGNAPLPAFFDGTSADGAEVFFDTDEALTADDDDSAQDVYERSGSTTTLRSAGPAGGAGPLPAFFDTTSRDGTRVLISTDESLVVADTDDQFDVYEQAGGSTTLVSTGPAGGNGAFDALFSAASADGSKVVFETDEQLVATDHDSFVDVYQRAGGMTTLLSLGPASGNGAFDAYYAGAAADGSRVFLETEEQLVASDTDADVDVYQRAGGVIELVSTGPAGGNGAVDAFFRGVSSDGARAFFVTAEPLVGADGDARIDVYERVDGTTTLLSTGPAGGNGAHDASYAGASDSGRVVFLTTTEQLASPDGDSSADLYATRVSGYPRPQSATPTFLPLVLAYEPCSAGNRTHAAPLAAGSCAAPEQASSFLTVGTADANQRMAQSSGFVRLVVTVGDPGTPADEADVTVTVSVADVRRQSDLGDYDGELDAVMPMRVTDGANGSGSDPATVVDMPLRLTVPCTATPEEIGAACSVTTGLDAVTPGSVVEGRRAIWQLGQVEVTDGGTDGLAATGPNAPFMRQGVFAP